MKTSSEKLSPRLSAEDLYIKSMDPIWWDKLDKLATHPASWPALREWIERADTIGVELAGTPPPPPTIKCDWLTRVKNILPVVHKKQSNDVEDTEQIEPVAVIVTPHKTVRARVHAIAVPLTSIVLVAILVCGIYWNQRLKSAHTPIAGQVQTSQSTDSEYRHELDKGRQLVATIQHSPVAQEVAEPTHKFETELASGSVEQLAHHRQTLEHVWMEAMQRKVDQTNKEIAVYIEQLSRLTDTPVSDSYTQAHAVASQWNNKQVTTANLNEAIKAETKLRDLIYRINEERSQTHQQEVAPQPQTPPVPKQQLQQPQQLQPHTAPARPAPAAQPAPAPTWSVPPAQNPPALPGRDGSL